MSNEESIIFIILPLSQVNLSSHLGVGTQKQRKQKEKAEQKHRGFVDLLGLSPVYEDLDKIFCQIRPKSRILWVHLGPDLIFYF